MESRKLWAVIQREYLERVRTRWFVLATVFGPIVFGTLMYLPAYMATRNVTSVDVARIRILDATGTDVGHRIAVALNGGLFGDTTRTRVEAIEPAAIIAAESTATRAVINGSIKGFLILEPGVFLGRNVHYAGANATSLSDMQRIENIVRREVLAQQMRSLGISAADAERLKLASIDLRSERITAQGRAGSGQVSVLIAISVAMLLYVTIFIYGQNVLRGVIEEKQSRVAEIVVSSVKPTTLLAGKVLGVGAVGLTRDDHLGRRIGGDGEVSRHVAAALRGAGGPAPVPVHRLGTGGAAHPVLRARLHVLRGVVRRDRCHGQQ